MISNQQRALELIEECATLEPGSAKVATAQEAVRQADLSQQLDLQLRARDVLIDAATFAGRAELSLVAFAWNLAHLTDTERDSDAVWYHFQWIAEDTPLMLATRREDIEHILTQMEEVYAANGWYRYPVDLARFRSGEIFGATRAELRDDFDNLCRTIERTSNESMYLNHVLGAAYLSMGQFDRGIAIISRNFAGTLREDTEYPTRCHAILPLPLRELGRHDEAAHHFELGCRMVAQNPVYIRQIAGLVAFASLTGDLPMLVGLLDRHLDWAATNFDRWSSMRLYVIAAWALEHLDAPVSLRLHEDVPGFRPDGRYDPRDLATALHDAGVDLAQRFDARHGRADWVPRIRRFREDERPLEFLLPPDDFVSR